MTVSNIGVLLINIGSPDQPTPSSVKSYLKKFLSDPRIVAIPKIFWWPILHGIILRIRPKKSAKLYQKIWTEKGSPLIIFSQKIADKLQQSLQIPVQIGMHYGKPSIQEGIETLRAQQVEKILILPMYPQYSATTTAVSFDQVAAVLKKIRDIPEIRFIHDYATNENYIRAICHTVQSFPLKHLLFSFHGIPKRYIDLGDPYSKQCYETVNLIAKQLNLSKENYSVTFQSRVGYAEWLTPYTDKTLQELPKKNIKDLHVICPGFSVDCLETLEEIVIRGQEQFLRAGGKNFHYIPALNDCEKHISVLKSIIERHIQGW